MIKKLIAGAIAFIFSTFTQPQTLPAVKSSQTSFQPPKLSITNLLEEKNLPKNIPQDQLITLIATGDVIPARSVNFKMTQYNDFTYPFQKTAGFLRSADVTLINLEAPLVDNCPLTNEGMVFCGNKHFVEGLQFAGIDVANLANNHSLNHGLDGLCQTVEVLDKNNISVSGLPEDLTCSDLPLFNNSQLLIQQIKNSNIGFLGFNILNNPPINDLTDAIKNASASTDFLVVSFHWGAEYTHFPAPEIISLSHTAIDNGADLIIGNHPHWIQPIEVYKNKLIIYALGNFVFDQEWSRETKTGLVAKLTIYKNSLTTALFYPVFITDYSQPQFLEGKEKEEVLDNLKKISQL